MGLIGINNKYRMTRPLGSGSFGNVYDGYDIHTTKPVVIKVQKTQNKGDLLRSEYEIYKKLHNDEHITPICYDHYVIDSYNVLVMEKLGLDLEKQQIQEPFTLIGVCKLACQLIKKIEYMHRKNIIHRDIKPANVLFNTSNDNVFLIDYGMGRSYLYNKLHIKHENKGKIIGTLRFNSVNANSGYESSRKDDLISFGYMLIFLVKNKLPWQNTIITRDELLEQCISSNKNTDIEQKQDTTIKKNDLSLFSKDYIKQQQRKIIERKILNKKQNTSINELCTDLPEFFGEYISYVYNLKFDETPNYNYIYDGFLNTLMDEISYT
jgi:casein kinase 1